MKKFYLMFLSLIMVIVMSFNACAAANATKATKKEDKIDYDLVQLKGQMLYSQVVNIMEDPDTYVGKRVRLIGNMGIIDGADNKKYFIVNVGDVTSCCTTGLEFVIKGGSEKVEDYPEVGKKVRVNGVLESYKEGTQTYLHLVDTDVYVYKDKKK